MPRGRQCADLSHSLSTPAIEADYALTLKFESDVEKPCRRCRTRPGILLLLWMSNCLRRLVSLKSRLNSLLQASDTDMLVRSPSIVFVRRSVPRRSPSRHQARRRQQLGRRI